MREKMFYIVPEPIIKQCAENLETEHLDNTFARMLAEGNLYREALLTPIYIHNSVTKEIVVTSQEWMQNKFH